MRRIVALNVSHLFKRELLMYSFGDIKLKKPISLKKIGWFIAGFALWSLPLFLIFGTPPEIWLWVIYLAPPIAFGHYVSKPIFGGKGLIDWTKAQINFIQQPRGWSDLVKDNDQEDTVFFVEQEIAISRRREISYLSRMIRQRAEKERKENSTTNSAEQNNQKATKKKRK